MEKAMNRLLIIATIIMVFCTSCTRKEFQPEEMVNILTLYPAPEIPCIESSHLFYHNHINPEPLSKEQLKILSTFVCETKPNHVWFVRVLYNRRDTLNATIYFLPDYSSERLRKGKFTSYNSFFGYKSPKRYLDEHGFDPNEVPKPEYYEYVDVLPKYYSPSPGQTPISDHLIPFSVSTNLSDQEIIEISDFIRFENIKKPKPNDSSLDLLEIEDVDPINRNLPIMLITKEGKNIKVTTGTQEGPWAGIGQILEIKKIENGYELVSIGMWVI
jgi:hypothetical protein